MALAKGKRTHTKLPKLQCLGPVKDYDIFCPPLPRPLFVQLSHHPAWRLCTGTSLSLTPLLPVPGRGPSTAHLGKPQPLSAPAQARRSRGQFEAVEGLAPCSAQLPMRKNHPKAGLPWLLSHAASDTSSSQAKFQLHTGSNSGSNSSNPSSISFS